MRSRRAKPEDAPGEHCVGCRALLADDAEERRTSGATLLPGVGWFCGHRCEQQYRFRFRIQPTKPQGDGPTAATAPTPPSSVEAEEDAPSAEEVLAALRERRRRRHSGG